MSSNITIAPDQAGHQLGGKHRKPHTGNPPSTRITADTAGGAMSQRRSPGAII
jgi:hypothetical protein